TINAIAEDARGELIDPYNGVADLRAGVLRHVSAAFAEDPVRILRAARFVARFGFSIAPETLELMREMVKNGEVDALVPERVWQELARGLMEDAPSRFITTLRECGALARILPEVDALFGVPQPPQHHPEIDCGIHTLMVTDVAARAGYALEVRFAAMTHDLGKGNTPKDILPRHIGHETRSVELLRGLSERLRVPAECRDLALLVARYHGDVHRAKELRAATIVRLLYHCDAWRKPERFGQVLQACVCDARGRTGRENDAYPQAEYLLRALHAAQQVNAGEIAQKCEDKTVIAERVREARVVAVAAVMGAESPS
ncbi:MAG: multifunctional CCA addition/repair protein, partial [Gallionellaceae bacterium]|nr:multifunctional CCA addition/repair protein [Gallionellaceae bacterium]